MPKYFIIFLTLLSFTSFSQKDHKLDSSVFDTAIYFNFGSSEILPSEYSKLQELLKYIDDDFEGYVKMMGHTDNVGKDASNLSLSEKRIDAIINYFLVEGKNRIYFVRNPEGERLPVADNSTDEGRRQNRRVELELFKKNKIESIVSSNYAARETPIENGTMIKFIVKDQLTDELIHCDIKSLFDTNNYTTYEAGKCDIWYDLEEQKTINYEFYSKGYFHQYKTIKISPLENKEIVIHLTPIKEGAVLDLTQVLFKGGKTELLESSIPELQRLLKTLQENENFTFEIGGHVNIRRHKIETMRRMRSSSGKMNKKDVITSKVVHGVLLSEARAKKILQYLEDNGIAKERMSFKGYGNSEMPYPYAKTKEEQAANRRVEIRVTGVF